jgi:hypothetical protein
MSAINEYGQIVIRLGYGEEYVTPIDGSGFDEIPLSLCENLCKSLESMVKQSGVEIKLHNIPTDSQEYYKQWFLALIEQYQKENPTEETTYEHVEHPSHYNTYSVETIDMMVRVFGKEKVADFCEINAFKYRMRMGTKPFNSIEQDLKKEQWYLNKAKELRNEIPIVKENEVVTTYC